MLNLSLDYPVTMVTGTQLSCINKLELDVNSVRYATT